jgi:hypothetical protein
MQRSKMIETGSGSKAIFLDSETCGLCGPMVLLQWAEGDGPVQLHSVWKEPIQETMDLLEKIVYHPHGVVGFNLAFDWFQIQKLYNMFQLVEDKTRIPQDMITELALLESRAREGDCLKPVSACDLMLVARRGPYQSTMNRKSIIIRRIPNVIAFDLAKLLEEQIEINDIYFSRKKKKGPKWNVVECPLRDNPSKFDPDFKNIVLSFRASAALKVIANDLLGADRYGRKRSNFKDIELDRKFWPGEAGFAPFATAISSANNSWKISKTFFVKNIRGKQTWPALIKHHIDHWHYGTFARQYAEDDVLDTRAIYYRFGSPPMGDIESTLACMVASCRWRGYTIDAEGIAEQKRNMQEVARSAPRSAREAKEYIAALLEPVERLTFTTTKKMVLEKMVRTMEIDCPNCDGTGTLEESEGPKPLGRLTSPGSTITLETIETVPCLKCKSSGALPHPATVRAQQVLDSRAAKKEIEIYDKLLVAGRFHASFNVIGTLSGRMSGSDRFNPQAIKSSKDVRSKFTLARPGYRLCGGDFESFEVAIAEANYNDPKLRELLLSHTECYKCHGTDPGCDDCHGTNQTRMKIHALFGTMCFPKMTYGEIVKNKVVYTRSKSGFFAKIYGGNYYTLMTRLDVDEKAALDAEARFEQNFPGVRKARVKIESAFCSMRQEGGLGTQVEWHEPADYIENMMTPPFRRYFTLENAICKALFNISSNPPKEWRKYREIKVWRRDRQQTVPGSVQSALYGAAFMIQAANTRAAANHVIQSTGAEITKDLQVQLWGLQPSGIERWIVQPFNVHDEVITPAEENETLLESITSIVDGIIVKYKPLIPLIGISWSNNMKDWSSK